MILIRHGQSLFNLLYRRTGADPGIPDPHLTEEGRRQARETAARLREAAGAAGVAAVLTSPYTRALQTAEIIAEAFGAALEVEPLVRERCAFACDVGLPRTELVRRWPHLGFDRLPEQWWPDGEESEPALAARGREFAARSAARAGWDRLIVVTHWGFIRSLTGLELGNGEHVRFDPGAP